MPNIRLKPSPARRLRLLCPPRAARDRDGSKTKSRLEDIEDIEEEDKRQKRRHRGHSGGRGRSEDWV